MALRARKSAVCSTVGLVVGCVALQIGSAEGTHPGKRGDIAYVAAPTGRVFTVHPDGSGEQQVLTYARAIQWAPDGRLLAYTGNYFGPSPGGKKPSPGTLWRARADGTGRKEIIGQGDVQIEGSDAGYGLVSGRPAWAPGGRRLAFTVQWDEADRARSAGEEEPGGSHLAMYVVRVDGRRLRFLHGGHSPTWSPRGGLIAYVFNAGSDGRNGLATVRPDGRRRRVIYRAGDHAYNPDFSPGGRRLVFIEPARGLPTWDVKTVNLRTRRVEAIARSDGDPVWSPDGRWIAYPVSPRLTPDGSVLAGEIRAVRPDGTGDRRLFTLPFDNATARTTTQLAWQPVP